VLFAAMSLAISLAMSLAMSLRPVRVRAT
jgi:hypothetical protein